jgi:TonB family protein
LPPSLEVLLMSRTPIALHITGPDGAVTEFQSDQESVIIGSGVGAAVRVGDAAVSTLHCLLKVAPDGALTVIDLGSESGTLLGDRTVKEPQAVAPGDVLKIGASTVRLLRGGQAVPAPSASAEALAMLQTAVPSRPDYREQERVSSQPGAGPSVSLAAALAGTGSNAAWLFGEPLPTDAVPSESARVLQVALLWGDTLVEVQHFPDGMPVVVGDGAGTSFAVFSPAVGERFVLAEARGPAAVINVPFEAGLVVSGGGGRHRSKEQLRSEGKLTVIANAGRGDAVELALHDRAQVSFENVAFIIRYVRPSQAASTNTLEEGDFTFFKIASMCFMAFFALVAAMIISPIGELGEGDDIFSNPSKYVKLVVRPEKKQELKKFKDLSGVEEGAKAKEKEGKFGKQEAKKDQADPSKKGAPVVDANKREEDRKKVSSLMAGMFGGGAASNLFGPGGLGVGINNALGGMQGGAGVGDAQGVGGLGARGSGAGGGGTGLGLGGLGTKGGGRGAGGYGSIDLGGRGKDSTRIIPGKTTVIGGLDKDVIMKVIKRHQNEIKFCYEQELQKNPQLAGKVAVGWTIDPAGSVAEANVSETSIANANVESCILQRVRRWKFPEPQGGGVVSVNFPWLFKAAGDDGSE